MAILNNKQHIGKYEVVRLIKENSYCETYRVEDEEEATNVRILAWARLCILMQK